jgi:uncharacterized protein
MEQIIHRVLSFDGGGIRGLYQAALLSRLLHCNLDVAAKADVLAGTSTGAIVAAGLAVGMTPSQLSALYTDLGKRIFPQRTGLKGWWYGKTKLLRGAAYSSATLREALSSAAVGPAGATRKLGDLTLGDCTKRLIVPAVSISKYRLHVFDSKASCAERTPLVDVLMASAAAPTYFLPAKVGDVYYVDGGLCCNNPAFQAVGRLHDERVDFARIQVLSVSTGGVPVTQDGATYLNLRQFRWALPTIDLSMSGSSDIALRDCRLVGYHCRISDEFGTQIALDDYDSAHKLLPAIAQEKADDEAVRHAIQRWIDGPARTGASFAGSWNGVYSWQAAPEGTPEKLEVIQNGNFVYGECHGQWSNTFWGTVDGNVLIGEWKGQNLRGTLLLKMNLETHEVAGHWSGTGDQNLYTGSWSWTRRDD